jgi:Na+:H+ antiporter, NhaA family
MTPTALARIKAFIEHETTAGLILVLAAVAAFVISNLSGGNDLYEAFLGTRGKLAVGALKLDKPLVLWINDGLMAVFFFLVGLEIKREVLEGSLSSRDQIALPAIAALGGMAVPAAIFATINGGDADLMRGWAIPSATDIAFALGALALAGSKVPLSLKVFLLTLATLDDLGAILVIALFYTANLSLLSLALAGAALAVLTGFNLTKIGRLAPYVFVGFIMWVCVLKSGIHATLAGVLLAFTIPQARIHALEEALHPYVKFLILPLFAFANAGIPLDGLSPGALVEPLPLGIAAGLVLGKPIGILGAVGLAVALRLARLPETVTWAQMAGVACLAGIGFTMSLFIGMLAFDGTEHIVAMRIGVLAGSLISAALGLAILLRARPSQA